MADPRAVTRGSGGRGTGYGAGGVRAVYVTAGPRSRASSRAVRRVIGIVKIT